VSAQSLAHCCAGGGSAGLLRLRTLGAKLVGILFSIGAGLVAGKEGPFVRLPHRLSHCVSLTVSPTVSPSPSLPLCLPHRLSHCVSLTVSPTVSPSLCLPHRLSHCVSLTVSLTDTVSPTVFRCTRAPSWPWGCRRWRRRRSASTCASNGAERKAPCLQTNPACDQAYLLR
jgi:hypothetical protein